MAEPIAMDAQSSSPQRVDFLDLFYGTLFHPVATFKRIAAPDQPDNRVLMQSLLSVMLVSAMAPLIKLANFGGSLKHLWLAVPFSIFSGIFMWCFAALFVGLWAYAFSGVARIRTFLTLSGLASLPWIFMAPVGLVKSDLGEISTALLGRDEMGLAVSWAVDMIGVALFCLLGMGIWLWTVLLLVTAVTESYRLSADKVIIVITAPFAMFLVSLGWVIGFILNLRQMFSS